MKRKSLISLILPLLVLPLLNGCEANSFIAICNHEYKTVITKEATCTEEGIQVDECTKCGYKTNEQTVEKKSHALHEHVVPANCVEDGYKYTECEWCGIKSQIYNVTPKLGHHIVTTTIEPTCTTEGYTITECDRCDYEEPKSNIVTALGHNYVEYDHKDAACEEEGHSHSRCSRCGDEISETYEAKHHHYVDINTVQATCTTEGYSDQQCEYCGDTIYRTNIVPCYNHDYETITINPTCTSEGYSYNHCKRCDHNTEKYDTKPKLNHNYKEEIVEPTCLDFGYTLKKCEYCNDEIKSNYVDPLNHDYETKTVSATCTTEGYKIDKCKRCGHETDKYDIEEALGHSVVVDKGYAATCTKEGKTDGSHCDRCGEILSTHQKIAKTQHNYVEARYEPTCTNEGFIYHICTICYDYYIDEVLPAHHTIYISKAAIAPTCTEAGSTAEKSCSECHQVIEASEIIPATNHTFKSTVIKPTCTEQGYTLYECLNCSYSYKANYTNPSNHYDTDSNKKCDSCGAHLIYNESDFLKIANDLSGNYVLMNDITMTSYPNIGIKSDWADAPSAAANHANPFTGTLTSNRDSRKTITNSVPGNSYASSLIYLNEGTIEGIDVVNTPWSLNGAVANGQEFMRVISGLVTVNNGVIKNCTYKGEDGLTFEFSRESAVAGNVVDCFYFETAGLAYINETNGLITKCQSTATYNFECNVSLSNRVSTSSGKYEEDYNILKCVVENSFSGICYENKGTISYCTGNANMTGSSDNVLAVSAIGDAIVHNENWVTYGYGNVNLDYDVYFSQMCIRNKGVVKNCTAYSIVPGDNWTIYTTVNIIDRLPLVYFEDRFPNRIKKSYDVNRGNFCVYRNVINGKEENNTIY